MNRRFLRSLAALPVGAAKPDDARTALAGGTLPAPGLFLPRRRKPFVSVHVVFDRLENGARINATQIVKIPGCTPVDIAPDIARRALHERTGIADCTMWQVSLRAKPFKPSAEPFPRLTLQPAALAATLKGHQ